MLSHEVALHDCSRVRTITIAAPAAGESFGQSRTICAGFDIGARVPELSFDVLPMTSMKY